MPGAKLVYFLTFIPPWQKQECRSDVLNPRGLQKKPTHAALCQQLYRSSRAVKVCRAGIQLVTHHSCLLSPPASYTNKLVGVRLFLTRYTLFMSKEHNFLLSSRWLTRVTDSCIKSTEFHPGSQKVPTLKGNNKSVWFCKSIYSYSQLRLMNDTKLEALWQCIGRRSVLCVCMCTCMYVKHWSIWTWQYKLQTLQKKNFTGWATSHRDEAVDCSSTPKKPKGHVPELLELHHLFHLNEIPGGILKSYRRACLYHVIKTLHLPRCPLILFGSSTQLL